MSRNQMLQKEITAYAAQISEIKKLQRSRRVLISRMSTVRSLQSKRELMVHLFDELIKITPVGVFLNKIEGKENIISASGYAQSPIYVSEEIKNTENNKWIHHPVLSEIKKKTDKKHPGNNKFMFTFVLG
ncbi:PilN domain-containing protein [Legionella sp.]|uniref:PilN domain-containing protein n=1 Tax=Legionella sp. TaxID=459 RepID=UPI003C9D75CC